MHSQAGLFSGCLTCSAVRTFSRTACRSRNNRLPHGSLVLFMVRRSPEEPGRTVAVRDVGRRDEYATGRGGGERQFASSKSTRTSGFSRSDLSNLDAGPRGCVDDVNGLGGGTALDDDCTQQLASAGLLQGGESTRSPPAHLANQRSYTGWLASENRVRVLIEMDPLLLEAK